MILVIDNYDSFTYNLVQYLGELGADVVVRRNDAVSVVEIGEFAPSAIVLSPGPCTPKEAGVRCAVSPRVGHDAGRQGAAQELPGARALIRRLALVVLLVVSGAVGAKAQDTIHLRDAGPGGGPPSLIQALAARYIVIPPAGTRALLAHETPYGRTVIVLGRDVIVEGTVQGDVIVIGGDLYMHPGGDVSGRAVAIG